jgi:hypothetical protein
MWAVTGGVNMFSLQPQEKALEKQLIPLAIDVNKIALGAIGDLKVTSMRETLLTMIENLAASENGGDNL